MQSRCHYGNHDLPPPTFIVVVAFTLKAVSQLTEGVEAVRHATGTLDQFMRSVDFAQAW